MIRPLPTIAIALFLLTFNGLHSQNTIYLKNPSFEGNPRKGAPGVPTIEEWQDCALKKFPSNSPPDLHPVPGHAWGVRMNAYHEKTFLGLVIRYDGTFETISQALSSPLRADTCYSVSVALACSSDYVSTTNRKRDESFAHPGVLMILGGNNICGEEELLVQSVPVENKEWKLYELNFQPAKDYQYITVMAFYTSEAQYAYNGNLLIDNFSPIIKIDCN